MWEKLLFITKKKKKKNKENKKKYFFPILFDFFLEKIYKNISYNWYIRI